METLAPAFWTRPYRVTLRIFNKLDSLAVGACPDLAWASGNLVEVAWKVKREQTIVAESQSPCTFSSNSFYFISFKFAEVPTGCLSIRKL